MEFLPTIIAGDMVKVFSGVLFLLFCFASIIPGFPMLCENLLVSDNFILGLPIIVKIILII